MAGLKATLGRAFHSVESFFDDVYLSYKWRYNRFFELTILPYRGFGTAERVWLRGRVVDDRGLAEKRDHNSVLENVAITLRRIESDEIPGATVRIRFYGQEQEVDTDDDGFFEAWLCPESVDPDRSWHDVHIELIRPRGRTADPVTATGQVFITGDTVEYGLISDLDDTVIRTGAQNKLQMSRVVLLNSAASRTPFPGVAAFYRALLQGPDARGSNPIFYVSSSPWNLYSLFDDFMEKHDIPAGPVLLRDFGFAGKLLSGSHRDHKQERIGFILDAYPDLDFILIGDSGQKDPEIYEEIVERYPDRIRTIYIRDVTPPDRDAEVRAIAKRIEQRGVSMELVRDTIQAAEDACRNGLITKAALAEVQAAHAAEVQEARRSRSVLERLLD